MVDKNESVEFLGNGVSVIISKDHGFGTDALLLADFAAPKSADRCCDLGTGCGIIPLLWCRDKALAAAYAVEIQQKACDQFKRSAELSNLTDSIKIIHADLRNLKDILPFGSYHLVTMNPPYKPVHTGILSETKSDQIARHETMCTLHDAANAAASLLNFGGRFCMCHRPERLCDVIEAMRNAGIEPKRLRFVSQREGLPPWLFLIEGKKGSKPHLKVLPQLYIKDNCGNDSKEIQKIIGMYAEGKK